MIGEYEGAMIALPPAPYPDETPDYWARDVRSQDVRGETSISRYGNGDFAFHSRPWQTIHGDAIAVRDDHSAFLAWGVALRGGRRVHCRRSGAPTSIVRGPWRRRSDDGRSWVVGQIRFTANDISFEDGIGGQRPPGPAADPFSQAMADQPVFLEKLRDDSFAWTLNNDLRAEALCTVDGLVGWEPSIGDAADAIVRLRGFWENWAEYKYQRLPAPPPMPRRFIEDALAAAGWRYQTDEDYRRLSTRPRRTLRPG
jgi:hypothetical protein